MDQETRVEPIWESFCIPGMDCPEELKQIRAGFANSPGVLQLESDFVRRVLHVQIDPNRMERGQVEAILRSVGFPADTLSTRSSDDSDASSTCHLSKSPWQLPVLDRTTWMGAGFLLAAAGFHFAGYPEVAFWLAGAATLVAGWPVFFRAIRAIRWGQLEMHVLMSTAAIGSILLGDSFEGGTAMVLFGVASWIERLSSSRASRLMDQLAGTLPDMATRQASPKSASALQPPAQWTQGNSWESVPTSALRIGDLVLIKDHERIPTDGSIENGSAEIDESSFTGESLPLHKVVGDEVFGGTRIGNTSIQVRVSAVPRDAMVSQLQRFARDAKSKRSPTQAFVSRFAAVYTPIVLIVAVMLITLGPTLSVWLGFASTTMPSEWLRRGLVLLVIACPCALVISTPLTLACGMQAAARLGILFKGGDSLETAATIRAVAFDKTGTLTTGLFSVERVLAVPGETPRSVLKLAALMEQHAQHPIATAILAHASREFYDLSTPGEDPNAPRTEGSLTHIQVLGGLGVIAREDGIPVAVGNQALMEKDHDPIPQVLLSQAALHTAGPVIYVARHAKVLGCLFLIDTIREDAIDGVRELRRLGISRLAMLTGDHAGAAKRIQELLQLDEVHTGLKPNQKNAIVQELRQAWSSVLMVGDGVNDAAALAEANVGVSLGEKASSLAHGIADVVALRPRVMNIARLIQIGRQTRRRLRENIAMALGIKLIAFALTATGLGTMWMAVAADVGGSLLVTANGLRMLASWKPPKR
jgi:Zn2+/Cd2+-exporting ATPase